MPQHIGWLNCWDRVHRLAQMLRDRIGRAKEDSNIRDLSTGRRIAAYSISLVRISHQYTRSQYRISHSTCQQHTPIAPRYRTR
eukprot:3941140-Rhodomonas_salina.3